MFLVCVFKFFLLFWTKLSKKYFFKIDVACGKQMIALKQPFPEIYLKKEKKKPKIKTNKKKFCLQINLQVRNRSF